MSADLIKAETEAAFEIAYAQDGALRAFATLYGKESISMIWQLGHMQGRCDGLAKSTQIREGMSK